MKQLLRPTFEAPVAFSYGLVLAKACSEGLLLAPGTVLVLCRQGHGHLVKDLLGAEAVHNEDALAPRPRFAGARKLQLREPHVENLGEQVAQLLRTDLSTRAVSSSCNHGGCAMF